MNKQTTKEQKEKKFNFTELQDFLDRTVGLKPFVEILDRMEFNYSQLLFNTIDSSNGCMITGESGEELYYLHMLKEILKKCEISE